MIPRDPIVMLLRTGSIKSADKSALRKAGIVVAECDFPSDVRFLRAEAEISGGEMLAAVLLAVKERVRVGADSSALAAAAYRAVADTIINAHDRTKKPAARAIEKLGEGEKRDG